jgi:hypothetical protein
LVVLLNIAVEALMDFLVSLVVVVEQVEQAVSVEAIWLEETEELVLTLILLGQLQPLQV